MRTNFAVAVAVVAVAFTMGYIGSFGPTLSRAEQMRLCQHNGYTFDTCAHTLRP